MLVPIFTYGQPLLVAAYAAFMLVVGSHESASRPAFTYPVRGFGMEKGRKDNTRVSPSHLHLHTLHSPLLHLLHHQGMVAHVLGCLGAASFTFLAYALAAAVRPSPWWNAQYSIPTLGLMLGNAVTGVAVGLGTLLDELGRGSGGDGLELMLCLGASRWEAARGPVARAAKLAMTPILNQLSVVGLVWIPGMMTGQMIAGADPAQVRGKDFCFLSRIHSSIPSDPPLKKNNTPSASLISLPFRPPGTRWSSCSSCPRPPCPRRRRACAWPRPRWWTGKPACGATG
jgi:hypothetical protein